MRALGICLAAALLAGPLVLAPAAQADDDAGTRPCGKKEVCLYSQEDGHGAIVYRNTLEAIEKGDITNVDPKVEARSARTPLPPDGDCAIGLYPDHGLGGDATWIAGPMTNLAKPGEPSLTVGSMYEDCG
ncbi:hypothetical protein [Kitasatospora acidiphila]|uniref:hypothetical protein n=1 Tax=Kitasatospora acidiphila TaxID=2567942 RepID=UPI003C714580